MSEENEDVKTAADFVRYADHVRKEDPYGSIQTVFTHRLPSYVRSFWGRNWMWVDVRSGQAWGTEQLVALAARSKESFYADQEVSK